MSKHPAKRLKRIIFADAMLTGISMGMIIGVAVGYLIGVWT